jgi:flagellar biogenesis protein FliO
LGGIQVLTSPATAELAAPSYLWSLLQMVGALLLTCLLAYLLLRGLRGLAGRRAPGGAIRVLERCPLSARHSLWVVEVGQRCLLLGCSEPGGPITRLAELDRDSLPVVTAPPARSFREVLARLGGRGRERP